MRSRPSSWAGRRSVRTGSVGMRESAPRSRMLHESGVCSCAVRGRCAVGRPRVPSAAMRIAMLTSECEPFAKTGGLADVVDALARALGRRAATRSTSTCPATGGWRPPDVELTRRWSCSVPVAAPRLARTPSTRVPVTLWTGAADGYRLRLVEHDASLRARRAATATQAATIPDNGARFTLLGRAALEAMRAEARPVDVLHGHDWQAGPGILSLRTRYAHRSAAGARGHRADLPQPGLSRLGAAGARLEPGPAASIGDDATAWTCCARRSAHADLVNTVSPTYARESLTPEYGGGLDDVLRDAGDRYIGIMNGIDPGLWDPATDRALRGHLLARRSDGKAPAATTCAPPGLDAGGPVLGRHRTPRPPEGLRPRDRGRAGADRRRGAAGRPGHRRPHAGRGPRARWPRRGRTGSSSWSASTATRHAASTPARTCS